MEIQYGHHHRISFNISVFFMYCLWWQSNHWISKPIKKLNLNFSSNVKNKEICTACDWTWIITMWVKHPQVVPWFKILIGSCNILLDWNLNDHNNDIIVHLYVFLIYFLEYVTLLDSWHERLRNGNLSWILLTKTSYV